MTEFPCTQCGQCCKSIGITFNPNSDYYKQAPQAIKTLIDNFPYPINSDNSCSALSEDNLCTVYDNRPIICNTSLGADLLNIPKPQFFKLVADQCNTLITEANLDPKYLVQISEVV